MGLDDYLTGGSMDDARFAGSDYVPEFDDERLRGQIRRIFDLMRDEKWRTLGEIEESTGDPQASISAQLRHLRKPRFGSHTIELRSRGDRGKGLFEYRLIVNREGLPSFLEDLVFEGSTATLKHYVPRATWNEIDRYLRAKGYRYSGEYVWTKGEKKG